MTVKQFYDAALSHASYAILSDKKIALVDPSRDTGPYLEYAGKNKAKIVAVFETHPHADFASSHLELHQKYGAVIYVNPRMGVSYPHRDLDNHEEVEIGNAKVRAVFTPGHSPDHNAYLLIDPNGKPHSIFTGDSLFVGDVGRPDLREDVGNVKMNSSKLAKLMFNTINTVYKSLPDDVLVFPTHGGGSLCGKNLSDKTFSTIGEEKHNNWAFQLKDEKKFVDRLLSYQPLVPQYFPFEVDLNRNGSKALKEIIEKVPRLKSANGLRKNAMVIDARSPEIFKKGHIQGALNIPDIEDEKFETWLGTLVSPNQEFYLIADKKKDQDRVLSRVAKIGYENNVLGVLPHRRNGAKSHIWKRINLEENLSDYNILDVRNKDEHQEEIIFDNSMNIPLFELNDRIKEIDLSKPILIHCSGGYRSAIAASVLETKLNSKAEIYDLGDVVMDYHKVQPVTA